MRIILKYLCKKQIFTISSILILGLVGIFASTGCTVKKEEAPIWALALAGGGSSQTAADGEAGNGTGIGEGSGTSGATAKLPVKTGQTTVYEIGDDGTHQTGTARSYTGPTQHGTYTGDYTTKDNATGLVWKTCSQGLSGATCATGGPVLLDWANASDHATNGCTALNSANAGSGYAGTKTWRLPTRQELELLPDYSRHNPAINTTAFPGTDVLTYWSSTTYAANTSNAWNVSFVDGNVSSSGKTAPSYVRCVSGP